MVLTIVSLHFELEFGVSDADNFARLLVCSISPGPVTLASLMDPDSYEVSSAIASLNREQELARYDLFPMYPTCRLGLRSALRV